MHKNDIIALDNELLSIIQDFLLLSPLSWSKEAMRGFLKSYEKGNLKYPKVEFPQMDFKDKIAALSAYVKKLGISDDPLVSFLRRTAESYQKAYFVLDGVGTKAVNENSRALYGGPNELLTGYNRSSLDVAQYFLRICEEYNCTVDSAEGIYNAAQFKKLLEKRIKSVFKKDIITVNVDSSITARATAGSNYVKIRKGARFSESDLDQLFDHEVMIHTLTYINGRKQPILKTMGYNAPRTTATQEGLAVFAEYINSSIELDRLKRIALRIIAIDMAEKGADFIDLFKFFQSHGQNVEESYYSTMRIFRGGSPEGGIIFYKDNAYLYGLIEVTSFLKTAMHDGFIHDIALLFSGKLTTGDVLELKSMAAQGMVIDPAYMPEWAMNSSELAAHLALNDLTERFYLED